MDECTMSQIYISTQTTLMQKFKYHVRNYIWLHPCTRGKPDNVFGNDSGRVPKNFSSFNLQVEPRHLLCNIPDDSRLVLDPAVHDPARDVHALPFVHRRQHRVPQVLGEDGHVVPVGLGDHLIRGFVPEPVKQHAKG